jgi:hypothetical protein
VQTADFKESVTHWAEVPKCRAAVLLGQRNRGRKKTITPELAKAMRDRLALRRLKRWEKKEAQ